MLGAQHTSVGLISNLFYRSLAIKLFVNVARLGVSRDFACIILMVNFSAVKTRNFS
jgi:hypothetical protein